MMKKRIIALFAIVAVFGLALFAYAQNTSVHSDRSCCTKDSCPMKKKDGEVKATSVSTSEKGKNCCDNCDCCKGKHDQTA